MKPRFSSFRSTLLNIHRTTIKIKDEAYFIDTEAPLITLEKMVILLEDKRFLHHSGVDIRSIARELWKAARRKKHGGASTIEMQLIRTISQRYERTLGRKFLEIFQAILLQKKFSKIEILRVYMNLAYMGTGIKGFSEAAKRHYPNLFNISDEEWWIKPDFNILSVQEAATLASMLVYPKPRLPNANWTSKIARRSHYGISLFQIEKQRFK
jgi:penicillin-binding protein 1A